MGADETCETFRGAQANARLIAAAPETAAECDRLAAENARLREALESVKDWMERLYGVRHKWEAAGMKARYDEVCAALEGK